MPILSLDDLDKLPPRAPTQSNILSLSDLENLSQAPAAAPVDPMKQKAEAQVRSYRKDNPIMSTVEDTVRRVARGTGLGSLFDEAGAGVVSMLPESWGGMPYDRAKALINSADKIGDDESTVIGKLPLVGDVSVGGLTKLAGGIASAPFTPALRVASGTTLLPRIANAAATGAAYGTVYGAGEGDSAGERAKNAGVGFALGGGLGALATPVAAGIGNAVESVANRMRSLPQELQGYSRDAVNRTANVASEMDNLTPQDYAQHAQRLGQEGMLGDMGTNLTAATEGLAQQPGPASRVINSALDQRAEAAPGRITQAVDQALGSPEAPAQIKARLDTFKAKASPLYDQFYASNIQPTPELRVLLKRADQVGAIKGAQKLMAAEGADPRIITRLVDNEMTPMTGLQSKSSQRVANGQELDYVKRALDDLAKGAKPGSNEQRIYGGLAAKLRGEVDRILSPSDPSQSVWAQARSLAGEGIEGKDAIVSGYKVFSGKQDPWQVASDRADMSASGKAMHSVGARNDLRGVMGRAATNFGPKGDAAARRALNSDFAAENLAEIAGPQNAQALRKSIDAENAMAETYNQVTGNSATARRLATRDMIPRQYDQSKYNELGKRTTSGLALEGFSRLANFLTAGALNERNAAVASDMADMLVAQGLRRDQVARGLFNYAQRQQLTQAQRQSVEGFIRNFMRGTTGTAVGAATSE